MVRKGGNGGRGEARRHSCHRGRGQGQGRNGRGAHVLDLRKQETLKIQHIVACDMGQQTTVSNPVALSYPVPPVLRDVGSLRTLTGRGGRGETRGRRRGGKGNR